MMPITPLFAAVLALIYFYLIVSVIRLRLRHQVSIGSSNHPQLENEIRIHGNFSEHVPFLLLLIWFVETVCYATTLALILSLVLVVSRVLHIIGMRKPESMMFCRKLGTMGAFFIIIVASLRLIWQYLPV